MTARPLPATPDEIDADWMTWAMAARHPGVRVATVEVIEVHEVTNTHVRLGLTYDSTGDSTGNSTGNSTNDAPAQVFCKMAPLDPAPSRADRSHRDGAA